MTYPTYKITHICKDHKDLSNANILMEANSLSDLISILKDYCSNKDYVTNVLKLHYIWSCVRDSKTKRICWSGNLFEHEIPNEEDIIKEQNRVYN